MIYKNAFCKGIGCHPQDRKFKCCDCGKDICSTCKIDENKKSYCINCFILSFPKALNEELNNLDKKQQKKKHQHYYNDNERDYPYKEYISESEALIL